MKLNNADRHNLIYLLLLLQSRLEISIVAHELSGAATRRDRQDRKLAVAMLKKLKQAEKLEEKQP